MKTNMQTALQQLNDLGQTSDKIILIGTGNQYSENDDVVNKQQMQHPEELAADRTGACKSCWHSARCEQWSQTRAGMTAANKMLVELVLTPHYDALTLVDKLEDITKVELLPTQVFAVYRQTDMCYIHLTNVLYPLDQRISYTQRSDAINAARASQI